MNNEDIYNAWKEQKSNMQISPDFTSQVMGEIDKIKQKKKRFS